jgi:Fe2+ or Zn2+ uptake regulation protein
MGKRGNKPGRSSIRNKVRAALEKAGWRYTRQRAAVYDFLAGTQSHPTAEEVFAAVRPLMPNISLATVYKALEALVDGRLINKLPNSDGPARYDCLVEPHYHLRDVRTGNVYDLETPYDAGLIDKLDPTLIDRLGRQGFEITGYRLELLGHSDR